MDKILLELDGVENRKARFKTIISLVINGEQRLFEGIVDGVILKDKLGSQGFGYDPIFVPNGYDKTFAELSIAEKNKISHRARAVNKLVEYLNQLA
jgi:XTP/dITP diphosphohydrolase